MDWDECYSEPSFVYGTNPNDFLAAMADRLPPGKILSLAEGEGRNAVFLAAMGYDVTGVDGSVTGLRKADQLAAAQGVAITTIHADLGLFKIGPSEWDGVIAIYCHLPPEIRAPLHRNVVTGLKRGGVFILEAYSKEQYAYNSGGPRSLEMLMDLDELKEELAGLEFVRAVTMERDVREGSKHTGPASVVQILGIKP